MRFMPTLQTLTLLALFAFIGCASAPEGASSGAGETGGGEEGFEENSTGEETGEFLDDAVPGDALSDTTDSEDISPDSAEESGEETDAEEEGGDNLNTGGEETGVEPGEETGEEAGEESLSSAEDPVGTIAIVEIDTLFGTGDSAMVGAGFQLPPILPDPLDSYGDCRVDFFDPEAESPTPPTLNAGEITVQGLLLPVFLHPKTTVDGPVYESTLTSDTKDLFGAPGSPISIYSNGGLDVPAFTGVLTTPMPVALIEPATGLDKSIDTSTPLVITWNPDEQASRIVLFLTVLDYGFAPVQGPVITCVLEGDPGSHVVPAAALQSLPIMFLHKLVVSVTRVHELALESTPLPITLVATHTTAGIANAN
jgi:hypothetical protein